MNILSNVNFVVAAVLLALLGFCCWEAVAEFLSTATTQTVAFTGLGGFVAGIVVVGSALLSPRRF